MRKHRMLCLALSLQLLLCFCCGPALAYQPTTLRPGKTYSAEVKTMQEALIKLGYLHGTPDGIYGTNTENAVKKFQKANGLKADGLAGTKTLDVLYTLVPGSGSADSGSSGSSSSESADSGSADSGSSGNTSSGSSDTGSSGTVIADSEGILSSYPAFIVVTSGGNVSATASPNGYFSGNYSTIRLNDTGSRVKLLQQGLITLGFLKDSADGIFGKLTLAAVTAFQKDCGLEADGLAGKATLVTLEKHLGNPPAPDDSDPTDDPTDEPTDDPSEDPAINTITIPSVGQVKLLHWFNDIKPSIKTGQHILIVDPATGISWTLRLYSLGRHADSEPLTADDTAAMLQAFGGVNTWNQKAVYVKLPDGTWTIGSTHDMPHMSGSIKDNNFDGHLCVHFLRDMDECKAIDPNYGVANQQTIRAFWKSLTGVTVE